VQQPVQRHFQLHFNSISIDISNTFLIDIFWSRCYFQRQLNVLRIIIGKVPSGSECRFAPRCTEQDRSPSVSRSEFVGEIDFAQIKRSPATPHFATFRIKAQSNLHEMPYNR
jgi:hypothetical protein